MGRDIRQNQTSMRLISRSLAIMVMITVVGAYASAAIRIETQEGKLLQGTLTKLDPNTHTLTMKGSDGQVSHFIYTDDTKVVGSIQDMRVLAGTPGVNLRITYRAGSEGEANYVIRIEVLPYVGKPGGDAMGSLELSSSWIEL
jgi:hypothetical protein